MKVKAGNVTVRLYPTPYRVNGTRYKAWTVAWLDEAGRQRKTFADRAKAQAFADDKADLLDHGYKCHLTRDQIAAYNRAHDTILPTGRTLEQVATDVAEAHKLAPDIKIAELARFWALHHAGRPITPKQALDELLAAKTRDGRSADYIRDLRIRIGRFAKAVTIPLPEMTATDLDDWINNLKGSNRSRRNYRAALGTLFQFAIQRRYLPKQWDELPPAPRKLAEQPPIAIYTPQELTLLVRTAAKSCRSDRDLLPTILLGALAGIRTKEIQRLDWSQVGKEWIEVTPKRTRTASRRLVPILPALARWLETIRKPSGPVCKYHYLDAAFGRLAERAGVKWKRNGLRHSFISYRLALVKNPAEVALECGNSPAMIFQHYRERVTPAQAGSWFGVCHENVTKKDPTPPEPLKTGHEIGGGGWESNPPGTLLSPTMVLKTRSATRTPYASGRTSRTARGVPRKALLEHEVSASRHVQL